MNTETPNVKRFRTLGSGWITVCLTVYLALILFTSPAIAADKVPTIDPAWSASVSEKGFNCQERDLFFVSRLQCGAFFDGDQAIVVYYAFASKEPRLGNRVDGGANRLVILRYNAATGAFIEQREASVSVTFYRLERLANGNLLAFGRDAINIFDSSLKPIAAVRRKSEPGDDPRDYWVPVLSPSGNTIAIQATHQGKRSFEVRNAGLAVVARWDDPMYPPPEFITSDQNLAAITRKRDELAVHHLGEGDWFPLVSVKEPDYVDSAQFLPKGSIFVQTYNELKLFRTDKTMYARKKDTKDEVFEFARADSAESRFLARSHGKTAPDMQVLALPSFTREYFLRLDSFSSGVYDYDLSPSGRLALLLGDKKLKVFALPPGK